MEALKIAAVGVISAIVAVTVRANKPELAPGVTIATGIILLMALSDNMGEIISRFSTLIDKCRVAPEYFYTVVKLTAIAYITKFSTEVCRDCGESAIASKIELAGKIAVIYLTVPIIENFLEIIIETVNTI